MAKSVNRSGDAAYVLHSHDWSESSLILELLTRDHGRVVAVAKGAKRPYSQLRPVLMPFQRLNVAFGAKRSEDAEVWLLRHAEWAGGEAWPGGAAFLPGFYLNELLIRLTARHDPHPALFDAYAQTLQAMREPALLQAALRAFELLLLRELGHLPDLSVETVTHHGVASDRVYEIHPQLGILPGHEGDEDAGSSAIHGANLIQIEQALDSSIAPKHTVIPALMAACVPVLSELKSILRALIHYHLGSQTLRTRQLMMELQQS
ncbi:MAG TPA: DNA repair protein RecO [Aquabacterium sp.]|nr:DNA repair protein RecO [Aquabacterium sp.]